MKKRFDSLLPRLEEIICLFFLTIMFVSLFLQIGTRLLGVPLAFTEEVSRFSYVWITFIGFAYAKKYDLNIRVTVFTDSLKPAIKKYLQVALELLELAVLFFLLYWSIGFCQFSMVVLSPALELSMLVVYISVPLGFFLTILRSVNAIRALFGSTRPKMERG